jgi:PhnB protein
MAIKGGRPDERRVTAHLLVSDVDQAIDFYRRAFGATVLYRSAMPGSPTVHAQLRIAESALLVTRENPAGRRGGLRYPAGLGGATNIQELYVDDVDASVLRAVQAGGTLLCEPMNTFFGDRYAQLRDPCGHVWGLATVLEELTPEEIDARASQHFAAGQCAPTA